VAHVVSDDAEGSDGQWGWQYRRSSRSYGTGDCIEVAAPSGKRIAVRDSKNVHGAVLTFSSAEWTTFVAGVRTGKFTA
jgi:Domain of unknown function (DUF397)